jgi:hypothetical protein
MKKAEFQNAIQHYVVNACITANGLRNQGAPKVVEKARQFLYKLDLKKLKSLPPPRYSSWLDRQTKKLKDALPRRARKWGTARKALNLFMCHASLNYFLREEYRLNQLAKVAEVTLDSIVAKKLRAGAGEGTLPKWEGLGGLNDKASQEYQAFATQLANKWGVNRGCLDLLLWKPSGSQY